MPSTINKYASLVKFSHTLFALPFALIAFVYAILWDSESSFDWLLLVEVLFCMVFARNAAMGFNRWADRDIDAKNPRTANREIPSGQISPKAAMFFVFANAVGFIVVAAFINRLTLLLSPLALFIILGYSLTKRFTAWSHIVLGTALAIAPVGAYVAVTGKFAIVPILIAGIVLTWVSGFDILYSMQDAKHDKAHKLHSVPARFSARTAKWISLVLHLVTIYAVVILGLFPEFQGGILYWTGAVIFIILLIYQQGAFRPSRISRIGASFGLVNGASSVIYACFAIADMLVK